jgi:hypothetical protein
MLAHSRTLHSACRSGADPLAGEALFAERLTERALLAERLAERASIVYGVVKVVETTWKRKSL